MTPVAAALLRTVAYFDTLDYPLTVSELVRWGQAPLSFGEVAGTLLSDQDMRTRLNAADGFWCLTGRESLIPERLRRARIAERKMKRARRAAAWLRLVPGVRLIAVANTLALAASRDEADIDLFIITAPGMLWTARAGVAGLLAAARARPEECLLDPLCASFFVSEDACDLSALRIPDDIYLAHWVATLFPISGGGDVYRHFWQSNRWVLDILPNCWPRFNALEHGSRGSGGLSFLERPLRRLQEKKFPFQIRELLNQDTRVVATDRVLKFHTNDRRAEYRDRWVAKCRELGVSTLS